VLVGDVWVCGGQSNMAQPGVGGCTGGAEAAAADQPALRYFNVPNRWAAEPQRNNFPGTRVTNWLRWQRGTPDKIRGWSGVPFFFGREIQARTGRPVGLLAIPLGASNAECWIPTEALGSVPEFAEYVANTRRWIENNPQAREAHRLEVEDWERRKREAEAKGEKFTARRPHDVRPELFARMWAGVLYNSHVAPLRDLPVRGVIWYQGENNANRFGGSAGDVEGYDRVMRLLIGEWRRVFAQPELPFYTVQLANFRRREADPNRYSSWAEIREAQARTAAALSNVELAVIIDVGTEENIHPPDKRPVGERLAALALRHAYGLDLPAHSPEYAGHAVEGARIRLRFRHAEGGLVSRGEKIGAFAVAGTDRRFHWAEARIEGGEIVVGSEAVPSPVAVRYAFADNPEASLYNRDGFPLGPFRTDDWPLVRPSKPAPTHDISP
jgi:sialate O-acetylesterase